MSYETISYRYMNCSMVRELATADHEIGSHSWDHAEQTGKPIGSLNTTDNTNAVYWDMQQTDDICLSRLCHQFRCVCCR
jgi:hypothetical protein